MTTEEKLDEAIRTLQFVQGFTAPEMQGFLSEEDKILFAHVTEALSRIT